MIKKFFALLLFVLIVLGVTACSQKSSDDALSKIVKRDKLIIGTKYDTKPFGFVDENQELVGFEIDLGRKFARQLLGDEKKVEFIQVLSSNRILALSSGEVDILLATVSMTPQREKVIEFSNPYFKTGIAILVQKDSDIKTVIDLNKRPVVFVLGTTGEKEIRTLAPEAKLYGFRTYTDGYSALKTGRGEAMVTDKSILMGIAMNDPNFKLLPHTYTEEYYGIGMKKGESSKTLKLEINKFLDKIQANGELQKLKQKWGV